MSDYDKNEPYNGSIKRNTLQPGGYDRKVSPAMQTYLRQTNAKLLIITPEDKASQLERITKRIEDGKKERAKNIKKNITSLLISKNTPRK